MIQQKQSPEFPVRFTLSAYRVFPLTNDSPQVTGGRFPWIARDPETGFFYSSLFLNTNKLQRYRATYQNGAPVGFEWCGEVHLSQNIDRVQGGDFSPSGRLYLATDPQTTTGINKGLIKVVEMGGHLVGKTPVDCGNPPDVYVEIIDTIYLLKQPGTSCFWSDQEEIEGITFWDLDDGSAYQGKNLGQLHTILLDLDCFDNDDLYLKHTRVLSGG